MSDLVSGILSIYRFQWQETFNKKTWLDWLLMIAIPVGIVILVDLTAHGDIETYLWGFFATTLIAGVIPGLNLLLWLTPLLSTELEGNTWTFISVRPGGKLCMVLGKYLATVSRAIVSGLLGLLIVILVTSSIADRPETTRLYATMALTVVLASLAYGCLFAALGVIFHKRAMVFTVSYTLLIEVMVSMLPAVINKLSITYYLRSIVTRIMDWSPHTPISERNLTENAAADLLPEIFSPNSTFSDLIDLTVLCAAFLTVACVLTVKREYTRHTAE